MTSIYDINKKYGVPKCYCSCPLCGRVYGSKLTGKYVDSISELCETCRKKEILPNKPVWIDAMEFVVNKQNDEYSM